MTRIGPYTLRFNKRITDVFKRNSWDVYVDHGNAADTYAYRWIVETPEGFCLAFNDNGKTALCDPCPTKEAALEGMLALEIAKKIEGNGPHHINATWTASAEL